MTENLASTNVENEYNEEEPAVYSTKFLFSKDLYYDFGVVSYNRTKKIFLIFLCLATWLIWINLISDNYDVILWFGPAISFVMCLTFFRTKQAIKVGYERTVLTGGGELTVRYALLEDKIIAYSGEAARDIFYEQVTKFYETNSFLLLYLKHNVYVTIEKSGLNASIEDVKSFLAKKCTAVKKKKFIDCSGDKKWSVLFLMAMIVVAAIGTIAGLVLKSNSIF